MLLEFAIMVAKATIMRITAPITAISTVVLSVPKTIGIGPITITPPKEADPSFGADKELRIMLATIAITPITESRNPIFIRRLP
jgi:hypothetical protein